MTNDTIYITGITPQGSPLIGGIWRLYRQEGFPIDISMMIIREKGCLPDIMELFAEATYHCELPQVKKQCPELFTDETINRWVIYLKQRGLQESDQFVVSEKIILEKRKKSIGKENHGKAMLLCSALREANKNQPIQ